MLISRSEWEEKCDTNRSLIKDKEEKMEIIEKLEFQLKDAEIKIIQLEDELRNKDNIHYILKDRIENASRDNKTLMDTNNKLTEWLNKIINEIGIYEVNDIKSITIPIYKNPIKTYSGKLEDFKKELPNLMNNEEIIIPEIRFLKIK